jgi:hypothetical protein
MSANLLRSFACLIVALGLTATAAGQDELKKQKALAAANLKKAGVGKVAATETSGMVLYATAPDDQTKALAASIDKVYQASRTALKVGEDEALWPGKLTVVVISDPNQFADYVQQTQGSKPEPGQTSAFNLAGDSPYLVIGPTADTDPKDFDPARAAARAMAAVVLNQKAGMGVGNGTLPAWLTEGFAEGMLARSDESPKAMTVYRNQLRSAALGHPRRDPQMAVLSDAWTGPRTRANNTISAAFNEYLMDRLRPSQYNRFLAAFRPVEGQPTPTTRSALRALPLSRVSMETDFKVWAGQQR